MALDPMERDRFRRRLALKMGIFLESARTVSCISGHYNDEPAHCELCQDNHATELLVLRNRAGKTLRVALQCLKEMVRFQVCDVEDLPKWLDKLKDLRLEHERRKEELERQRVEERKLRERRVIVRKRAPSNEMG